jgi:REP element-mobilizing transposase RayT
MPRGPRLDAPETLQHVIVQEIEGRVVFRDDQDRNDFRRRLGEVVVAKGLTVYAWALVPNHLHVERVCAVVHIAPTVLQEGSRRTTVCRAREGIAYLALEVEGYTAPRLVALLGVRPPSIHKAAQRGRERRERWDHVLRSEKK